MTTELITSWAEHDKALRKILQTLSRSLCIFDEDLTRLNLEGPEFAGQLRSFLAARTSNSVNIVLRSTDTFRRNSPRLMQLLKTYPERMRVSEAPPHLLSLTDNFVVVDDTSALIRFHRDNVRSKAIYDDASGCRPYAKRFEELLKEGGEQLSATTLGL